MSESHAPAPRRPHPLVRYLPLLAIAAAFVLAWRFGLQDRISLDTLREQRLALEAFVDSNLLLSLVMFVAIYAAVVAVSLPVSVYLTLAGGFLFGTWIGGAATWIGATTGATLLFLAARTALGDVLRRNAGPWMQRFEAGFRDNAFNYLLALRFLPIMPFWVVNLVPAFFNVRLKDFVLATLIGTIPAILVFSSIGAALNAAFAAGTSVDPAAAARDLLFSPIVIGPILGLAALSLAPVIWKALRKEKRA